MRIGILALQGAFIEHEHMLRQLGAECAELRKSSDLDGRLDGIILPGGESTVQRKLLGELGMYEALKEKIQQGLPVLATCAGLILLAEQVSENKKLRAVASDQAGCAAVPESTPCKEEAVWPAVPESTPCKEEAVWPAVPESTPCESAPCSAAVCFASLPVAVRRNAYGRQLGSFSALAKIRGIPQEEKPFPLEFIRAPYIASICNAKEVEPIAVIGKLPDGSSGENIVGVRYHNQIGLAFHPELTGDTRCHEMFLSMCCA